jgi:hypothetical protein
VIVGFTFSVVTQSTKLNISGIPNIATSTWVSDNILQQTLAFVPSANSVEVNFNYSSNV